MEEDDEKKPDQTRAKPGKARQHKQQPGERTHLLVVPGVHSNKSAEEFLNHKAFRESIYHFSLLTKSHKQLEAESIFWYSLQRVCSTTT